MGEKSIRVLAYSGYKGNERPRSFFMDGKTLDVVSIISRWRDPDNDFFKVKTEDGKNYVIRFNHISEAWTLIDGHER